MAEAIFEEIKMRLKGSIWEVRHFDDFFATKGMFKIGSRTFIVNGSNISMMECPDCRTHIKLHDPRVDFISQIIKMAKYCNNLGYRSGFNFKNGCLKCPALVWSMQS